MAKDAPGPRKAKDAPSFAAAGTDPAASRQWLPLLRGAIGGAGLGFIAVTAGFGVAGGVLGPPSLEEAAEQSVTVVDRQGRLLRAFTTASGRWRLPAGPADVHPRYLAMLFTYEDRRFEDHRGVDPLAFVRSARQLATTGRIVSGGSTLTMQVARLLDRRHDRTGLGKLRQIVRAQQLERRLTKQEILALYLKLAPFGGNLEGVRAASLAYFGKEPMRLSVGEAALLVALPQAPESRRPDVDPAAARRARDRVLDSALEAEVISADEAAQAKREAVPDRRKAVPQIAAHLAEAERAADPTVAQHALTIDLDLQRSLEALAAEHARALGPKLSVAVLVVEHASGAVLAHVGSAGYLDNARFGAIDMTGAVRSPGSTLKPLIYGLAFEQGLAHPETLIEDRPTRFESYAPKNFDDAFHGTVSIREALQLSLNIPAVKVLAEVGPGRLMARLEAAGIEYSLPRGTEPSLAIALGGVGLRLRDLAGLYAGIARGGEPVRLVHRQADLDPAGTRAGQRLLAAPAAWQVAHVLRSAPAPKNAQAGEIAYKTGTSYGYRDAWAAGFDGKHVIAVWVGRPDGASTPSLTGVSTAAPILFDAFQRLGGKRVPLAPPPRGTLIASASDLPPPLRIFRSDRPETVAGVFAEPPLAIAFPANDAELEISVDQTGAPRPITLKADGGVLPLTWLVNDLPIASSPHRREAAFEPDGSGFVHLSVIDAKGRVDRVTIRVR